MDNLGKQDRSWEDCERCSRGPPKAIVRKHLPNKERPTEHSAYLTKRVGEHCLLMLGDNKVIFRLSSISSLSTQKDTVFFYLLTSLSLDIKK